MRTRFQEGSTAWGRVALLMLLAFPLVAVPKGAEGGIAPSRGSFESRLQGVQARIDAGRFEDAEREARALVADAELEFGHESLQTADALDALSTAMRRAGNIDGDEPVETCQRALRIKSRILGEESVGYAQSLHNWGVLQAYRGDFEQAKSDLERCVRIRERRNGVDDPEIATSLIPLGHVTLQLGDPFAARRIVERAVAIREKALPSGDSRLGEALSTLGGILYEVGAYAEASDVWERALEINQKALRPNHPSLATCHHNLAVLLTEIGDYEGARRHYEVALRIRRRSLGPDNFLVASTLDGLGLVSEDLGKFQEAKSYYERSIRIKRAAFGEKHIETAWTLYKVGVTAVAIGRVASGLDTLERAKRIQLEILGPSHPDVGRTWDGIGQAKERQGDLGAALAAYEKSRDIRTAALGSFHPDVGVTLDHIASVRSRYGEWRPALEAALRAAEVRNENLTLTVRTLADRSALAYASVLGSGLETALALLSAKGVVHGKDAGRVWDALLRSRSLVLDEMAARRRIAAASEDPAVAEAVRDLQAAGARYAALLVRGPQQDSPEHYRAGLDRAREDVEKAERRLGSLSLTYRTGRADLRVGLEEVARGLPPQSALLAYAWFGPDEGKRYLAFVLPAGGEPVAVPLGSAREIDSVGTVWLRSISRGSGSPASTAAAAESECREAGRAVRARIWDPVSPHLGRPDRVFIVPDGALYRMNAGALPVGDSAYLVEAGPTLHYLSAERDIASHRGRRPSAHGLFAVGGPAFDETAGGSGVAQRRGTDLDCGDLGSLKFAPLPETVREVREIASRWSEPNEVLVLTGAEATESAVKRNSAHHRVVHLATHGFFLGADCSERVDGTRGIGGFAPSTADRPHGRPPVVERPLFLAGLALAGANRRSEVKPGKEDGILTAEEIASMDLSDVEWVVLSACDTGIGKVQAREGVIGLRRAFQIAGAGTLIMSLWSVEDRSTRDWMSALYRSRDRPRRSRGAAECVQEASRTVLRERRAQARSTHPFYWAAFVAVGDWN